MQLIKYLLHVRELVIGLVSVDPNDVDRSVALPRPAMLTAGLYLIFFLYSAGCLSFAQCTSPVPPVSGVPVEESGADGSYEKLLVDSVACSSAGMAGCSTAIGDLKDLQQQSLSAAIKTLNCAENGATSADKSWFGQRAAFWNALLTDMKQNAPAVANGTYMPSHELQMQYLNIPPSTPITPVISGSVNNGGDSVQGRAQAVSAVYSSQSKIYVCVWAAQPAKGSLDCTAAGSSTKPAALTKSDNKTAGASDYVLATAADGTFTAQLTTPLKGGQYVSLVEISTPAGGAPQTIASAQAVEVQTSSPANPSISGSLDDSDPTIQGSAQAVSVVYSSQSKIYVCVWAAQPAKGSLDCTAAGSSTKPAALTKSDNKTAGASDYVLATAADGTFTAQLTTPLKGGQYVSLVEISTPAGGAPQTIASAQAVEVQTPSAGSTSSLFTLALVGVNSTGTSASGPNLQYFVSFDTMAPVPLLGTKVCGKEKNPDHPLSQKCWVWMNPRIASAPAPSSAALTSFSSPTSLASGVGGQTVSEITQTFDLQAGISINLGRSPWNGTQFGMDKSWARASLSFVASGGTSTPFNTTTSAPEYTLNDNLGAQFNNNPSFAKTYPILAQALCSVYGYNPTPACTPSPVTYKYVAFVLPNRSRFYSNYSAGFRLSTYFFTGPCAGKPTQCKVDNTYPGTFDIRFGQDETVTAGILRGVVMTLTGSYPLPGTSGALRIFGSSFDRLHGNENTTALALLPTAPAVAITDPSVVVQPIKSSDQDYYRLGIGVDLIPLISKWVSSSKATSGTAGK